jgi:hypothetical protein
MVRSSAVKPVRSPWHSTRHLSRHYADHTGPRDLEGLPPGLVPTKLRQPTRVFRLVAYIPASVRFDAPPRATRPWEQRGGDGVWLAKSGEP